MNRIYLILLLAIMNMLPICAQNPSETISMRVWSNGSYSSFDVENVDSVTFVNETDVIPGGTITDETFWQTESDFQEVLLSSYLQFKSFITIETRLVELAIIGGNERISPSSTTVNNAWSKGYNTIARCNVLIDAVEKMDASLDVKKYAIHAKFLRAITYYMMTQLWGNIPYVQSSSMEEAINPTIGSQQGIINDSYYFMKYNIDELVDLFNSNVQAVNPTNIRPLMNEIGLYVDGATFDNNPSHTDFIMNLDNDQGTYPIVDATYSDLIIKEFYKTATAAELSAIWKNNMPRFGVWNALKRLGAITPDYVRELNNGMSMSLLFPIPRDEIKAIPNLKQNEGYDSDY